jgi:hypothetical protein
MLVTSIQYSLVIQLVIQVRIKSQNELLSRRLAFGGIISLYLILVKVIQTYNIS